MHPKTIQNKDLAHHDHFDFLDELEAISSKGFEYVMSRAIKAILDKVRATKLKKSDELNGGWTGKVPQIKINFEKIFEETMSKYFDALRWILMGDAAGKVASDAAEAIGLKKIITAPGVVPSAYLNAIDTHRQHFEDVFGKEPPEMNRKMITESIDMIKKRTDRFADESLGKLQNRMIEAASEVVNTMNLDNISAVHAEAHSLLEDGAKPRAAVQQAVQNVLSTEIAVPKISKALRAAVERYADDWNLATKVDTGLASAVGTHQAITETFGRVGSRVRVAWFCFPDEKTCSFCHKISKHADGSYKIYDISEFEPAGYNFSRKKDQWTMCVPPSHYNCRCNLIYLPDGFDIDNNGSIVPKSKV